MILASAEHQVGPGQYMANLSGQEVVVNGITLPKCPEDIYTVLRNSLDIKMPEGTFTRGIIGKKIYNILSDGTAILEDYLKDRKWSSLVIVDTDIFHALNALRMSNKFFHNAFKKIATADQLNA